MFSYSLLSNFEIIYRGPFDVSGLFLTGSRFIFYSDWILLLSETLLLSFDLGYCLLCGLSYLNFIPYFMVSANILDSRLLPKFLSSSMKYYLNF